MGLTLNSSMERLATMGLIGDPMAALVPAHNAYLGRGSRFFKAELQQSDNMLYGQGCPEV